MLGCKGNSNEHFYTLLRTWIPQARKDYTTYGNQYLQKRENHLNRLLTKNGFDRIELDHLLVSGKLKEAEEVISHCYLSDDTVSNTLVSYFQSKGLEYIDPSSLNSVYELFVAGDYSFFWTFGALLTKRALSECANYRKTDIDTIFSNSRFEKLSHRVAIKENLFRIYATGVIAPTLNVFPHPEFLIHGSRVWFFKGWRTEFTFLQELLGGLFPATSNSLI